MPRTRAYRRHHRARVIANRVKLRTDSFFVPGEFAKRKPFDCGNPRCGLCHYEKYGDRTAKRMRAEREWRRDWSA